MSTASILPVSDFEPLGVPVLYLMRHGSTELNAAGKFRGWLDPALDSEGVRAARVAADFLAYRGLKRAVASNLSRASETARIICRAHGCDDPLLDSRLRPWNVGWFAGKPRAQFESGLRRYAEQPSKQVPQGESLAEFRSRFLPALDEYAVQSDVLEGPQLLVTHTSNIQAATGLPPEAVDLVGPGGIVEVRLTPYGYRYRAVFDPATAHSASILS